MAVTVSSVFIPDYDPDEALGFYRDALGLEVRLDGTSVRCCCWYTGLLDPIRKAFAMANGVQPALFSANSEDACSACNGADGGPIVFEGPTADLVASRTTLTGEHPAARRSLTGRPPLTASPATQRTLLSWLPPAQRDQERDQQDRAEGQQPGRRVRHVHGSAGPQTPRGTLGDQNRGVIAVEVDESPDPVAIVVPIHRRLPSSRRSAGRWPQRWLSADAALTLGRTVMPRSGGWPGLPAGYAGTEAAPVGAPPC
jgi:hypothetical protein